MSKETDQIKEDIAGLADDITTIATGVAAVEQKLAAALAAPTIDAQALADVHASLQELKGKADGIVSALAPAPPAPPAAAPPTSTP